MNKAARLQQPFFARSARVVAQALLGKRLVRVVNGERLAGIIVETEAYCDSAETDLACHASANKGRPTARTQVMFGPPAHVYVYLTYGMHWMLNIVTGTEGQANAVLIRAIQPLEGLAQMAANRHPRPQRQWTNGPAKLAQAMAIDKTFNGRNLCTDGVIFVENGETVSAETIQNGPRVGMGKTPEPWFSMPWRYSIKNNEYVSKYR